MTEVMNERGSATKFDCSVTKLGNYKRTEAHCICYRQLWRDERKYEGVRGRKRKGAGQREDGSGGGGQRATLPQPFLGWFSATASNLRITIFCIESALTLADKQPAWLAFPYRDAGSAPVSILQIRLDRFLALGIIL